MAKGSGTSLNLFSGMTAIGVLGFIGSVRSPTVTIRYLVPLSRTVCVTMRSSSATSGYVQTATVLAFSWHTDLGLLS